MQSGFPTSYLTTPKGVHTGSIVKVFDSTVANKFYSVFYYDTKGRVIQSCNNNSLAGFDTYFTSYNFSGSPVDVLHIHSSSTISSLSERYHYTYDHGGRLTQTTHSLNSESKRILAQNEYDELGHLRKKSYPGNLDASTYGYNVRGWIDQINSTHYRQAIHYGFWQNKSKSCYNGNPAGASYSTTYRDPVTGALAQTGEQLAEYGYNNDILSSSVSNKVSNNQFVSNVMSETVSPITAHAISRSYKGRNEDNLRLNLKGYELDRLYEGGMNNVSSLPIQFTSKYPNMTATFFYDDNGNLYKDLNRGITGIDYNLLNLPEKITFENGSNIRYRYDADGTKLRADYKTVFNELYTPIGLPVQTSSGALTVEHHIDYCDNLIYEDNILKKIRVDGGYINYNSSSHTGEYCYYITDQIGSNRVVLSETRGVIQYADYYPYGIPFSETPIEEDNFLHAGKELEKMHGLYWYDNGKRWYDPILCRFTTMDPLCEKYYDKNPYSYCADNPMKYGDVKGDSVTVLNLGSGTDQHMGLLIQDESGKWNYYSFNGAPVYNKTLGIVGGRPFDDIKVGPFDSPENFMNSSYNTKDKSREGKEDSSIDAYGYPEGYVIPTTQEQDRTIEGAYIDAIGEGYSLSDNHCAKVVQRALSKAGISIYESKVTNSSYESRVTRTVPYLPSNAYSVIKSNNPQGYSVYKRK